MATYGIGVLRQDRLGFAPFYVVFINGEQDGAYETLDEALAHCDEHRELGRAQVDEGGEA